MDIDLLKDDLMVDEGYRRSAYKDSEGYWTIGIGRMIDEELGGGISREEARYLLGNDVNRTLADLDKAFPWWRTMPEEKMRALANMCFQMGLGRLSGFKKMLVALQAHDWEEAARQALDSKWAKQTPNRAKRVSDMIRGTI